MHDVAISEAAGQLREWNLHLGDVLEDLVRREHGNVVFRKVNASFEKGDEFDQLLLDRLKALGKRSLQLLRRDFRLKQGLRFDQVADSFGLGKVDATVQKSAHRELPRFSEASPSCKSGASGSR